MKIQKLVSVEVMVDVDVDADDVANLLNEIKGRGDQQAAALNVLSAAWSAISRVDPYLLEDAQRTVVADALEREVQRFRSPMVVTCTEMDRG